MRHSYLALCAGLLLTLMASPEVKAQTWGNGDCTVSIWWPYSREKGDCLTDKEKEAGLTGNYLDPEGTYRRPEVIGEEAGEPVIGPDGNPVPGSQSDGRLIISNERGCTTGILWPYVRKPGDCLTDGEIEAGMTGVYGNSRRPGEAPPTPSAVNLAPLPAAPESDSGLFGLFGSGDQNFGTGGLLEDNLLPADQRNQ